MNNISVNDCYVIDNKWLDELDLPSWKEFKRAKANYELCDIVQLAKEFHEATLLNLVLLENREPVFGVTNATCFTMMGAKAFREGKIKPYRDVVDYITW